MDTPLPLASFTSAEQRPHQLRLVERTEQHDCKLEFNVMHGRPVAETLHVRRYQVSAEHNVATFDRSYRSAMLASPSHLVFLTALVHMQKMLYMTLCERWGLAYEANGPELLKIWPTSIEVKIPELVVEERDLEQELWLKELREVRGGRFRFVAESRVASTQLLVGGVTFRI